MKDRATATPSGGGSRRRVAGNYTSSVAIQDLSGELMSSPPAAERACYDPDSHDADHHEA